MSEATILGRRDNWAVVQLPSRKFPAIALQGDTFFILLDNVRRGIAGCPAGEPFDALTLALEDMEEVLAWYADILKQHGIDLPYCDPQE
jgi:hypothetical protein